MTQSSPLSPALARRWLPHRAPLLVLLLALGAAACDKDDPCGNGVLDPDEQCDGTELQGASCRSLGYAGGTLTCGPGCRLDVSGCTGGVDCGNGLVDPGEQCDGSDLQGASCERLGLQGGVLRCDPVTCQLDVTGCEARGLCGDGVADGPEACDGEDLRGATCATVDGTFIGGTLRCSPDCTLATGGCYGEPAFPLGAPCTEDADCPGGFCWSELSDRGPGAPGGYCLEMCSNGGLCPLTGPAGRCVQLPSAPPLCFLRCDPTDPDACRPGTVCQPAGDGGYCFPHCSADAECLTTGLCDTDSGSSTQGFCITPPEQCTGGVDEDFDGRIDCADPDCTGQPACPTGEVCGNGADDDGDGYADCDDAECGVLGICTGQTCTPIPGALLGCGVTLAGETNDASGATDQIDGAQCASPSGAQGPAFSEETGPEVTYTLTVASPQRVTLSVTNFSGDLDVYVLKAGEAGQCDPYATCFAFGGNPPDTEETVVFAAYPGVTYYVVVDGYQDTVTAFDLAVTCDASGIEQCGNGVDDDGDTLVDCDDPECVGVPPDCAP